MASSRNPFFFSCFEQHCKPSPSPVFPALTNLGQTGGTKGASNAIRCRFFRSPARRFPLPPSNPPFRSASSLCGPHLLFSLCSAHCCQKTSGECRDTPEPGNLFSSEAKLLACRLFALLHASLPGVPDLPTLRHILVRHLSSMQGKDVSPPDSTDKNVLLFPLVEDNRGCRASAPHYSEPRTARYWGATNLRNIPSETSCPQAATI